MQKHGIQARGKRRFRVTTTDSRQNLTVAPNVLDRKFIVAAPNQQCLVVLRFADLRAA
jgi:putative transposase